jgi:D-alanine-D-alanine ligase
MRVVVLMGGDSTEREISLSTGENVTKALQENGHEVIKIDLTADRNGLNELNESKNMITGYEDPDLSRGEMDGGARFIKNILLIQRLKPDVVFIALHGGRGENGIVQGLLDVIDVPYTGSGRVASMLAMEKDKSKIFFKKANLPVARSYVLASQEAPREIIKKLPYPQVVKPNDQGSTVGLRIVRDAKEMDEAIEDAFRYSSKVMVEEFIDGREMTVAIFKNKSLPVIEIKPQHGIYDYECKYSSGMSDYDVPADIDEGLAITLQKIAWRAHLALGCEGYSRVDYRINKNNKAYILEVNTLPGMTDTSLVPKAAKEAGINFNSLIEGIIEVAVERFRMEKNREL